MLNKSNINYLISGYLIFG